jgi:hypothetical protein
LIHQIYAKSFTLYSLAAVALLSSGALAQAPFVSDPDPTVTTTATEVVLHKELNGFPNYGQFDSAADVLYTATFGTYHFTIPNVVDLGSVQNPFFRASLVADDHNTDISTYSYAVDTNGTTVATGQTGLPHGDNFGGTFTNWVQRDYGVTITSLQTTITLTNTSTDTSVGDSRDWIGADWIELHLPLSPSTNVPEPGFIGMLAGGVFFGSSLVLRRRLRRIN